MIDYKAVQAALNKAGASPPLVVDGAWGPKSKAALAAFQRAHPPLVVDGALGPKSLAALGLAPVGAPGGLSGAPPVSTTPAGNPSDVRAYQVAKRAAPTMPEPELQYALTVARGEGHYGAGWSAPPRDPVALAFAKSKGLTGTEGAGSNNWGAEQGAGDAGSFPHVDFGWRNPDGSPWDRKGPRVWLPYIGKYKRHSTPEKGFLSVASTIFGGGQRGAVGAKEIKDAVARGDLKAAVYAQHANGYFELAPDEYLKAVERNYADLTSALNWRRLLSGAVASGGGVLLALLFTTGVTAAVWWWKRQGGPS